MKRTAKKPENEVSMGEMLAAQSELSELKKQYGIAEKEGRISRLISSFFERRENREEQCLDRKKYILLAVFTGWMGGHRFYAKQYPVAILYLLFFWTGFPMAMTLIDLLIAIPKPVDAQGNIYL